MLTALLFSTLIGDQSERVGSWLLLGSALAFGLPHGAADFWILKRRVEQGRGAPQRLILLLSAYTFLAALIVAVWYFFPGFSTLGFLVLTALHFGSGDQIWEESGQRDPAPSFLRGLVVISAPLAFHAADSGAVLKALAPTAESFAPVEAIIVWAPMVCGSAVVALLCYDLPRLSRGAPFPWVKWLELGLLTMFFMILTPLYAVAVYFVSVHSWRHVFRLNIYEGKTGSGDFSLPVAVVIADFYRKALPVTVLSLAGLAIVYLVFKSDSGPLLAWTSSYLILLSALTVPHAILITFTEKRLAVG